MQNVVVIASMLIRLIEKSFIVIVLKGLRKNSNVTIEGTGRKKFNDRAKNFIFRFHEGDIQLYFRVFYSNQ